MYCFYEKKKKNATFCKIEESEPAAHNKIPADIIKDNKASCETALLLLTEDWSCMCDRGELQSWS